MSRHTHEDILKDEDTWRLTSPFPASKVVS